MRDRVLLCAIGISFLAHLGAVCVIGRASGSRLGLHEVSKPHHYGGFELSSETTPDKPAAAVSPTPPPKPPPTVKPPHNPNTAPPEPKPMAQTGGLPGNPGSRLNPGSMSANGEVPVPPGGSTPRGWVPGTGTGSGRGSGEGPGVGTPDPPKNVDDGPGTHPAPAHVDPPTPKMVSVKICEESGLPPGEYCKNMRTKSFVDGDEPTRKCNKCKAPEPPPHVNRLADSAYPVLISGPKPRIPDSIDEGLSLSATVDCFVETDGSVSGARMSKSSGYSDLDRNILSAVSQRKYRPAVQGGVPQRVKVTIPFSLKT